MIGNIGEVRTGDWILTHSGIQFYPFDPKVEDINIEDIAHALSNQCRFAGHCEQFYSVAEHSVRVCEIVPKVYKLSALLHDASEAYLVDLPRPIKYHSEIGNFYRVAEDKIMNVISEKFNIGEESYIVKNADNAILCVEAKALLPNNSWWEKFSQYLTGNERKIGTTLTPCEAKKLFLDTFYSLTN